MALYLLGCFICDIGTSRIDILVTGCHNIFHAYSYRHSCVFTHIGASLIIGLWVAHFRTPKVLPGQFHASLLMLVTGLILVGIAEMSGGVNHIKIAVKILLALGVAIAAFIGQRKHKAGEPISTGLAHAVGGLAVINVAVATIWH